LIFFVVCDMLAPQSGRKIKVDWQLAKRQAL